jgi:hypothetical protein
MKPKYRFFFWRATSLLFSRWGKKSEQNLIISQKPVIIQIWAFHTLIVIQPPLLHGSCLGIY